MADSSGPYLDATAGPFDNNQDGCTHSGCHGTYALNSGNGSVTLSGPSDYYPGESYTITVTVAQSSPPPSRYGFEAIALRTSNNTVAGSYTPGTGNKLRTISGRSYIEHNFVSNTSGTWTFTWNAPTDASQVRFYVGGLAANGNSASSGDYAYSSTTTINAIQPITFTRDSTETSCFGACDGSAAVTVTGGGFSPYTYLWSTGSTTNSISNACGGTYTITITDAQGHTEEAELTVEQPDEIDPNFTVLPSSCAFGNGQISANPLGGVGGYNYQWNDTANTTDSVIYDAGLGWFTVTITDATGCVKVDSAEITASNSGLIGSVITTTENCSQANGTATIDMEFGNEPYTYSWTQGGATTASISDLASGTYTVQVTDNLGCQDQFTGTVTNVVPLINRDSADITGVTCYGSDNGSIQVGMLSGPMPYNYHWSADSAVSGDSISGLLAGMHFLTVTDAAGCTDTASFSVPGPDSVYAELEIDSANDGFCDGKATITMMGGTPPYHFDWSHQNFLDTNSAGELCGGFYLVTAIDTLGCLFTIAFDLPERLGIASIHQWALDVFPNPASMEITLAGVHGKYDIRISDLSGSQVLYFEQLSTSSLDVSSLENGTYIVQVNTDDGVGITKLVVDRK